MAATRPLHRLIWQTRRGALELDLLLGGYLHHQYAKCSPQRQACYRRLLQQDDPLLMDWLVRGKPPPPEFAPLVADILRQARSATRSKP